MLDIAPTELIIVAIVALIIIGPKDLPKAMRVVGYWVGRARGVARQFRAGFDTMVREAELADMEKQWKLENERIMREHPATPTPGASPKRSHPPETLPPPPSVSAPEDPPTQPPAQPASPPDVAGPAPEPPNAPDQAARGGDSPPAPSPTPST